MRDSGSSKTDAVAQKAQSQFAHDVRQGLTKQPQKELHSKYLYDALGSALFNAITFVPEYGLTRADERLIAQHADDVARRLCASAEMSVFELGAGDGRKARAIIRAVSQRQPHVQYAPVDVSPLALQHCRDELSDVADVAAIEGEYLDGLRRALALRESQTALVLFLGSNIGNFERACARDFLAQLRALLRTGDALLIGADLIKEIPRMLLAYDDPAGVTAAFNLNLLGRVNRELNADFDLRKFHHEARWCERDHRVEMHLRSGSEQEVRIPGADCAVHIRAGETIWTESSHKFQAAELNGMAAAAGFRAAAQWIDAEWPFAENLWIAE